MHFEVIRYTVCIYCPLQIVQNSIMLSTVSKRNDCIVNGGFFMLKSELKSLWKKALFFR